LIPYKAPTYKEDGFNCPFCHAHAHHSWGMITYPTTNRRIAAFDTAECTRCSLVSIWSDGKMVFPNTSTAPPANPDLPKDIKDDYDEASDVLNRSPRSACVLLRLCIEKLVSLEITGSELNFARFHFSCLDLECCF